jgi:hypothetical protein
MTLQKRKHESGPRQQARMRWSKPPRSMQHPPLLALSRKRGRRFLLEKVLRCASPSRASSQSNAQPPPVRT